MNVLVTGANGFVGRALVERLIMEPDLKVVAAVRRESAPVPDGARRFVFGDLAPDTDWRAALSDIDTVVHLAARVHVLNESIPNPLEEFRRVNTAGTANLARQARDAGVRRFVLVSSAKVFGETGTFTENDPPRPTDGYGISKWEAEQQLAAICEGTAMESVIIRPPLVYGPRVRANFAALVGAVRRGIPLPLGAVENRRSMVALDNLVDFIVASIRSPAAAGQTFNVSDGEDLSSPELVRKIARALGRAPRLFALPPTMLLSSAALLGQRPRAQRLISTLVIDGAKGRSRLAWRPPISVDEGIRRAVQGT